MYEEFYGMQDKPFSLTPDTSCLFLGSYHREALQFLNERTGEGAAVLALTGEVGSGKTVVLRRFVKDLSNDFETIQVFYPPGDVTELFQLLLCETGQAGRETDVTVLRKEFTGRLDVIRKAQKIPLIVIDEAQNLGNDGLREILMLCGNKSAAPRTRVVLCGQAPMKDVLTSLSSSGGHAVPTYHLQNLPHSAVPHYIYYRLAAAGCRDTSLFSETVIAEISRLTCGVPRLINTLCDAVLAQGYLSGEKNITLSLLRWIPLSMSCHDSAATAQGDHAAGPESSHDDALPMTIVVLEKHRRSGIHLENRLLKHGLSCTAVDSLEDLFSCIAGGEGTSLMIPVIDAAFFFSEDGRETTDGTAALERMADEHAASPVIVTSVLTLTSMRTKLFRKGIPYFLEKPDVNTLSLSDIDEAFDAFFIELQGCLVGIHRQFSAFCRTFFKSSRGKADSETSTAGRPAETPS